MKKVAFSHVTLADYINSSNAGSAEVPLPLHSTKAAYLPDIVNSSSLLAVDCDVFRGEKLCYLFMGRPSYKWNSVGDASHWMSPVVFVLRGLDNLPVKRIFPFDTGAFASRRLPEYLTVFDLNNFNIGSDITQIGRVIHAFYETRERFLRGENVSLDTIKRQVQITPRHAKIEALVRLYSERPPESDDRGRAIEIQVTQDIPINKKTLAGVVLPDGYKLDKELMRYFKDMDSAVEFYGLFPLNISSHFGQIYGCVEKIQGLIR